MVTSDKASPCTPLEILHTGCPHCNKLSPQGIFFFFFLCLADILEQILHVIDTFYLLWMVSDIKTQAYKQAECIITVGIMHMFSEDFYFFLSLMGWQ